MGFIKFWKNGVEGTIKDMVQASAIIFLFVLFVIFNAISQIQVSFLIGKLHQGKTENSQENS